MNKLTFRTIAAVLLSGCLTVAVGSAAAQTPTIQFSGSSTSGSTISGSFYYLQTKKATAPNSGKFDFSGDTTDPYGLSYDIITNGVPNPVSKSGASELSAFTLYDETYPKTLQVYATFPGTTIGILAPTNSACSPNSLPTCSAFTGNLPTGKFIITANGSPTTFIISVSGCNLEEREERRQFPSPQSPVHEGPAPLAIHYPDPAPLPAYYVGPASYAVSDVCQPRLSCGLTRLFCRRSYCQR
jgi:hypothetical protein